MNLYLIERTDDVDWDEYDSGVVAAAETEADIAWWPNGERAVCTVKLIGVAVEGQPAGLIHSSFNAS